MLGMLKGYLWRSGQHGQKRYIWVFSNGDRKLTEPPRLCSIRHTTVLCVQISQGQLLQCSRLPLNLACCFFLIEKHTVSQFPKITLTTRFTLSSVPWLTYSGLQYLNWGFRFMYILLRYEVLPGEARGNGGVERWRERKRFNPKKSWSQLILQAALERV